MDCIFYGGPMDGERVVREFEPGKRYVIIAKLNPETFFFFNDDPDEAASPYTTHKYFIYKTADPNKGLLIHEKTTMPEVLELSWNYMNAVLTGVITDE